MTNKRIDEKTPNGGDYSEIWFFDADGNIVDEEFAKTSIIRECRKDGTLISSTRTSINNGSQDNR